MSFRLLIECSKDISRLEIDFTDGTSSVIEDETTQTHKRPDQILDTNADFGNIQEEIVEKPNIELGERSVKVAQELQDFNL